MEKVTRYRDWAPTQFDATGLGLEVEEVTQLLDNYPVLDEADFSRRELEDAELGWEQASIAERIEALQAEGLSIFAARREDMPIECREHFRGDSL